MALAGAGQVEPETKFMSVIEFTGGLTTRTRLPRSVHDRVVDGADDGAGDEEGHNPEEAGEDPLAEGHGDGIGGDNFSRGQDNQVGQVGGQIHEEDSQLGDGNTAKLESEDG